MESRIINGEDYLITEVICSESLSRVAVASEGIKIEVNKIVLN